ncbi:sirohydrochlorin ferrochelatase [Rhodococcus sp. 27YEA15]|uniref:sirohydrochlorin chelatase n=1 Tax=Rhodococcus sp. 27YEA15 TaxID=3156259 RepID=UPI003C7DA41F
MIALIAVAHGSRDPRSARVITAAVDALRRARPDLDVRPAFLDLTAPSVDQVVDGVAADGYRAAVMVPMLLGSAFHAKVDLPALLASARSRHPYLAITQAAVLGRDPRLVTAVRDRILETGVRQGDPTVGVALAAVGSSQEQANADTAAVTDDLAAGTAWAGVEICFATSTTPSVSDAIADLRARGATRVVVAPWFLAPGLLTDRLGNAAADAHPGALFADTIGAHPLLVETMLDRFRQAISTSLTHIRASA